MPGESVVEGRCAAGILSHGQIVEDVFACVRLLPVYVKLFCLVMSPYVYVVCLSMLCLLFLLIAGHTYKADI